MSATPKFDPTRRIALELNIPPQGVKKVLELLGEGGTVPFIARYRKEATGSLDEVQIRDIEERRDYILALEDRRRAILESIEEQGKLTPELKKSILAADNKATLEDLYLPYKKKRRTRATIARERGLEPLAQHILAQAPTGDVLSIAQSFVNSEKDVADADAALAGARDIVAEAFAVNATLRAMTRDTLLNRGTVRSDMDPKFEGKPTKFEQYYDFEEALKTIPSHRFLAVRRGEKEGVLRTKMLLDESLLMSGYMSGMGYNPASPFASQLKTAVEDGYKRLLFPSVESDIRIDLKMRSDRDAVDIFANNLRNLLMAPLLGEKSVLGVDPGLRSGSKVVSVSSTGKMEGHVTIYPARGGRAQDEARRLFLDFLKRHNPAVVAVGNGTGGRETESFIKDALKTAGIQGVSVVSVNEAGASVYSASDVAREEFPELDLTIRGAISIARRLQDPLAELVKIDPKAIGVGQYQHDVYQRLLAKKLDEVVEDCVNQVGVELNTASAPLLARVAGVGPTLAKRVVAHREEFGPFPGRKALLKVKGLGPKTFEQAAGFLRVRGGSHPLDASGVHPERYKLVERMAKDIHVELSDLVGQANRISAIQATQYVGEDVGLPTLKDILSELKKPGRDPRESFEPPKFRDDLNTIEDLQEGMVLEGVVTNVTAFGAFVDVGVHQDGLVHISQLSDQFVKDPNEVVKVGDKLTVHVLEVDVVRKRISMSARSDGGGGQGRRSQGQGRSQGPGRSLGQDRARAPRQDRGRGRGQPPAQRPAKAKQDFSNNPFAAALKGFKSQS